MIAFFRKIRKKLLARYKSTYFLYAIGEIFLVVIGILIALSINNWNDLRKQRLKEMAFLKDIQLDLRLNLAEINSFIIDKESDIYSAGIIVDYCEYDTIQDGVYFNHHMMEVAVSSNFEEINNTYKELENSGQLTTISNKTIKNLLQNMDKIYRKIEFTEDHLYNDMRDLIYELIFHEYDMDASVQNLASEELMSAAPISINEIELLLKDKGFKNGFVLARYNIQLIIGYLNQLKEMTKELNEAIETELK